MRVFLILLVLWVRVCYSQSVEDNIVLINVESYDKGRIAKLICKINSYSPKVLSLDIAFPEYTGSKDDKGLYFALRDAKKVVLPSVISLDGKDYQGREMISVHLACAAEFYVPYAKTGFVSARMDNHSFHIPTQFIVWQKVNYSDYVYHHFSVVTAMAFDSLKASGFIQSHERLVDIDFQNGHRKFNKFSASEVLSGKVVKKDIERKIVMLGFLGPGSEDKFISPFNADSIEPDMYGLEYLANIVAQVLE